jgi:hypothetical protein
MSFPQLWNYATLRTLVSKEIVYNKYGLKMGPKPWETSEKLEFFGPVSGPYEYELHFVKENRIFAGEKGQIWCNLPATLYC